MPGRCRCRRVRATRKDVPRHARPPTSQSAASSCRTQPGPIPASASTHLYGRGALSASDGPPSFDAAWGRGTSSRAEDRSPQFTPWALERFAGLLEAVENQVEPVGKLVAIVVAGLEDVLDREFGEMGKLVGAHLRHHHSRHLGRLLLRLAKRQGGLL